MEEKNIALSENVELCPVYRCIMILNTNESSGAMKWKLQDLFTTLLCKHKLDGKIQDMDLSKRRITFLFFQKKDIVKWIELHHYTKIHVLGHPIEIQVEMENEFEVHQEDVWKEETSLCIQSLPLRWFNIDIKSKKYDCLYESSTILHDALSLFGTVAVLEVQCSQKQQQDQNDKALQVVLNFDVMVKYKEKEGFLKAYHAFQGQKMLRRNGNFTVPISIRLDNNNYFSESEIRKRRFEHESIEIEMEKAQKKENDRKQKEKQIEMETKMLFDDLCTRLQVCEEKHGVLTPDTTIVSSIQQCQNIILSDEKDRLNVNDLRQRVEAIEKAVEVYASSLQIKENEELEVRLAAWTTTLGRFQSTSLTRLEALEQRLHECTSESASKHVAMLADVKSIHGALEELKATIQDAPMLSKTTVEEDLQHFATKVDDALEDAKDELESVMCRIKAVQDILVLERKVNSWSTTREDCLEYSKKYLTEIDTFRNKVLPTLWVASTSDLQEGYYTYCDLMETYEEMAENGIDLESFSTRVLKMNEKMKSFGIHSKDLVRALHHMEDITHRSKACLQNNNISAFQQLKQEREQSLRMVDTIYDKEEKRVQLAQKRQKTVHAGDGVAYLKELELFHRSANESRKRLSSWQIVNGMETPVEYQTHSLPVLKHRMVTSRPESQTIQSVKRVALTLHSKAIVVSDTKTVNKVKQPIIIGRRLEEEKRLRSLALKKVPSSSVSDEKRLRSLALESQYRTSALLALEKKYRTTALAALQKARDGKS